MSIYSHPYFKELYHYGVKGMKWGVRRSPEELKYNKSSVIAGVNRRIDKLQITSVNGILIKEMSDHAGDRANERKVTTVQIIDALQKPLYIGDVGYDEKGRPSNKFIGNYVTLTVNPTTGVITSLWPTGSRTRKKYAKKGGV